MAALALTGLLVILWAAFVAFGYWHGGWRQVVLLAAMLLSYAVLSEWAAPNGHDLTTQFQWSIARTTTAVALLYLLVSTFVLGFLGSFALYRPRPLGPIERRFGAAMGAFNGGLLLALVLRTLRSYAFVAGRGRGQTLQTSRLSRFLIEDVGYLLLAALVLGGIAAVVGCMMARRDDAREMALLESVTIPAEPQHQEPPALASVPPVLPAPPSSPPVPKPIYAHAPLIDWPASPPPGTQTMPSATDQQSPKPNLPPTITAEPDAPRAPSPLPARPQIPPRVAPPMVYPLADLLAVQATPAMSAANAPRAARPVGPPPGATQDAPPPVVRELDVSTHEAPVVGNDAMPKPEMTPNEAQPAADGGAMNDQTPALSAPNAMLATTAIPAIPPPLPPISAPRPAATSAPPTPRSIPPIAANRPTPDELGPSRTGYARVAIARQASGRSDEPPPGQPSPPQPAPPGPLQPPLPTGPRVHPCPTCGYPVRDHARYCPNCGSRQGRP